MFRKSKMYYTATSKIYRTYLGPLFLTLLDTRSVVNMAVILARAQVLSSVDRVLDHEMIVPQFKVLFSNRKRER